VDTVRNNRNGRGVDSKKKRAKGGEKGQGPNKRQKPGGKGAENGGGKGRAGNGAMKSKLSPSILAMQKGTKKAKFSPSLASLDSDLEAYMNGSLGAGRNKSTAGKNLGAAEKATLSQQAPAKPPDPHRLDLELARYMDARSPPKCWAERKLATRIIPPPSQTPAAQKAPPLRQRHLMRHLGLFCHKLVQVVL